MHDNTILASRQSSSAVDESNSFSHYLSLRFYKDDLDHVSNATKDSINNFLKSISEIEDDFLLMMQQQQLTNFFRCHRRRSGKAYTQDGAYRQLHHPGRAKARHNGAKSVYRSRAGRADIPGGSLADSGQLALRRRVRHNEANRPDSIAVFQRMP
jgi:hypothetical protein